MECDGKINRECWTVRSQRSPPWVKQVTLAEGTCPLCGTGCESNAGAHAALSGLATGPLVPVRAQAVEQDGRSGRRRNLDSGYLEGMA